MSTETKITRTTKTKRNSNVAQEAATEENPFTEDVTAEQTAKKIEPNQTVNEDEMMARMEAMMAERLSKRDFNRGGLGVLVTNIKVSEGNAKTNADGSPQVNQHTGEVLKWDDSYYVDLAFMGGSATIWLDKTLASELEENKRYYATTKVKIVTNKEGKSSLGLAFTGFEKII